MLQVGVYRPVKWSNKTAVSLVLVSGCGLHILLGQFLGPPFSPFLFWTGLKQARLKVALNF